MSELDTSQVGARRLLWVAAWIGVCIYAWKCWPAWSAGRLWAEEATVYLPQALDAQSKGVECVSKPEQSPRGHWFFFAKDMDGNLIEMIDLKGMHNVLRWLGPLGGLLFRRGRYAQYYR